MSEQSEAAGLAEPMRSRWSPSIFDGEHVLAPAQVLALAEAARWAPSFGNSQPAVFVYLRRSSEQHSRFCGLLSRGNSAWVPAAAALFVATTTIQSGEQPDGKPPIPEHYSYYDLGQAAAHLTLQATAMGLVAHQFAGFDQEGAADLLGLPAGVRTPVTVAVGQHGDLEAAEPRLRERENRPRTRKPIDELLHHEYWNAREENLSGSDSLDK